MSLNDDSGFDAVLKMWKGDFHLTSAEHQNPSTLNSIANTKWLFQAEARWKREAEAVYGDFLLRKRGGGVKEMDLGIWKLKFQIHSI